MEGKVDPLFSVPQPQLEGSTGFMCWARGFMEIHSASGREAIEESLQRYCSTEGVPPLLIFPEEDTTNGRVGLLKFRLAWLLVIFVFFIYYYVVPLVNANPG